MSILEDSRCIDGIADQSFRMSPFKKKIRPKFYVSDLFETIKL